MANPVQPPNPGRAPASTGFDELRREVAKLNAEAQKKAGKARDEREQARIRARRQRTSL
jgi:hypothetical protein